MLIIIPGALFVPKRDIFYVTDGSPMLLLLTGVKTASSRFRGANGDHNDN